MVRDALKRHPITMCLADEIHVNATMHRGDKEERQRMVQDAARRHPHVISTFSDLESEEEEEELGRYYTV
jgi:GrpB-like predicted nucleotidyltransferase (UPF0157 family)